MRPTQSIAGDAFSVSVGSTIVCAPTKPIFVPGFCALIASATLQSFFSDGVEVWMMTCSIILRDAQGFLHADVVRRAIQQLGLRHQRGRLGQPGGIPKAGDLAPRLIPRARAAVKTVKGRGTRNKVLLIDSI